ncbi:MAG: choice-of-anchor D domain-containing protein [Anaerolineae bacterium]|nr:choice-of-anchor D domain-containing protein [Anaerolineae bacterium]
MFSKMFSKLFHPKPSALFLVVVIITLLAAGVAYAAALTINSNPLSIYVDDKLQFQVSHSGGNQIYGGNPGSFGTFLAVGSTLYGPPVVSGATAFTLVSQTGVTGDGTIGSPFTIVTTVDAGTTGLRLVHTDSYVTGQEMYTTTIQVNNTTGSPISVILYRGLDCAVGGGDAGYGWQVPAAGVYATGVACTKTPNNVPADITEQFLPIVPDTANYIVNGYSAVFNAIKSRTALPDTVKTDNGSGGIYDNGMAISWSFSVPASGSVTRSHATRFTNKGYGSNPAPAETIDVGNATVGSSVTTTLVISETGSLPLTVNSYSIRGDNPDDFSILAPTFPFSIIDGGPNVNVTIQCTPSTGAEARRASLIIRHDAPSGSTTYPLLCNGQLIHYLYIPVMFKPCICPTTSATADCYCE